MFSTILSNWVCLDCKGSYYLNGKPTYSHRHPTLLRNMINDFNLQKLYWNVSFHSDSSLNIQLPVQQMLFLPSWIPDLFKCLLSWVCGKILCMCGRWGRVLGSKFVNKYPIMGCVDFSDGVGGWICWCGYLYIFKHLISIHTVLLYLSFIKFKESNRK